MELNHWDWLIIGSYFAVTIGIGLAYSQRAGRSLAEYFVSGRDMPWWLAGTSMVATTFAADTPLAVTGLMVKNGLAGNWFWWAFALGGMFTVFVYSRLWRRAGIMTDVEFLELRYGGRAAAALRGVRAIYMSLLVNSIIIGWVTKAMTSVLKETVFYGKVGSGSVDWILIMASLATVGLYTMVSGLWGVAVTDFLQFFLAMLGCILLAVIAVQHVGGIEALRQRVTENFPQGEEAFRFFPDFHSDQPWMPIHVFLIMLLVQWWATWYPGAEPGGGGYVVQRMASCRDERHSLLATLWFQIAHYCIRPWPWLIVAFAALAMYPELRDHPDPGVGYAWVMRDVSPHGMRGLLVVTFFAAFMSTISTQMNWGASYLIRDVYQRFLAPSASERHLTWASRLASLLVLAAGGVAAWYMRNTPVDEAWKMLAAVGAGTGAVFMLRWFWWRISAWTEIIAMVASLIFYYLLGSKFEPTTAMVIIAGLTITTWVVGTMCTPPERSETLVHFFRLVRPGGPGWGPIRRLAPDVIPDGDLGQSLVMVLLATGIIFLTLPGIGYLILGPQVRGWLCLAGALACAVVVASRLPRSEPRSAQNDPVNYSLRHGQ